LRFEISEREHPEKLMAGMASHPGEDLAEELAELRMSAAELARRLPQPHPSIVSCE